MENRKKAVFGIYITVAAADVATDSLVKSGFSAGDVSALLPENLGSKPIATEKNSKAPEGAATGAGSGAVLGGTLGLLAGIGALAIPRRPPYRSWAHNGCFGRHGSRRRSRRTYGRANRNGDSRVRSKALRRALEEGRNSPFGPLRYFRGNRSSQGNHEEYERGRYFLHRRILRRYRDRSRCRFENSGNALITLTEGGTSLVEASSQLM